MMDSSPDISLSNTSSSNVRVLWNRSAARRASAQGEGGEQQDFRVVVVVVDVVDQTFSTQANSSSYTGRHQQKE